MQQQWITLGAWDVSKHCIIPIRECVKQALRHKLVQPATILFPFFTHFNCNEYNMSKSVISKRGGSSGCNFTSLDTAQLISSKITLDSTFKHKPILGITPVTGTGWRSQEWIKSIIFPLKVWEKLSCKGTFEIHLVFKTLRGNVQIGHVCSNLKRIERNILRGPFLFWNYLGANEHNQNFKNTPAASHIH